MEKLIELLNEYDDNNWGVTDYGALFNKMNEGISETEYLQVISKEFGFIKRLIDNDKIDREKYYDQIYKPFFWNIRTGHFQGFWIERGLLMLLAISDDPIEDLISYLK